MNAIVKVQISQAKSDGVERALIYDEKRVVWIETSDEQVARLVKAALRGAAKAYIHADFVAISTDRATIVFGHSAEEQEW